MAAATSLLSPILSLIDFQLITSCWTALRQVVWNWPQSSSTLDLLSSSGDLLDIFLTYGTRLAIGFYDVHPPTRTCLDPACVVRRSGGRTEARRLTRYRVAAAVLFTAAHGPIPCWSHSFACRKCHTRYYHNYYVHDSRSRRTYYGGMPSVLHVRTHVFVQRSLCTRFEMSMVCAWVSASNNARIYNQEHPDCDWQFPARHPVSNSLSGEIVWDTFFMHCLLRDHCEKSPPAVLLLSNIGLSDGRLRPALQARNLAMVGPGQEQWNHACDLCFASEENGDGISRWMRAAVTDGVTQSRFCPDHEALNGICAVVSCDTPAQSGFRTCSLPEHRALKNVSDESKLAMFQLRKRLQKHNMTHLPDSVTVDGSENLPEID